MVLSFRQVFQAATGLGNWECGMVFWSNFGLADQIISHYLGEASPRRYDSDTETVRHHSSGTTTRRLTLL